jgi:protein tyrosine/serine phosphatase
MILKHSILKLFLVYSFSIVVSAQEKSYTKIDTLGFKRFYQLNTDVYRSEQPSKKEMQFLESYGIKTILNFRRKRDNIKKAKGTSLKLERLPLKAKTLNEDDVFNALKLIKDAEKPILVHCWHGSDRTGAIMAAYRMVFENWTKEKAIAEFTEPHFGYHKNMYPNLIYFLEHLNVIELKTRLGLID